VAKAKKKEEKIDPEVFLRQKLLGRKLGMTQVYEEDGTCVPVTLVEAGPCVVIRVKKSNGADRYNAVQIGFGETAKNLPKPQKGHFEKAGVKLLNHLAEIRLRNAEHGLKPGSQLTVSIFDGVDKVDVSGISKGRGFAGTIRRWHFKQGPTSHGSMNIREPGAVGASSDPSRVFKGQHMAGHLGAKRATCRNLRLLKVEEEKNLLLIEGSVPGPKGGLVEISASRTKGKKNPEKT
jgi:large subunit ribosomal protein L3